MPAPPAEVIRTTHGYHPVTTDLEEILGVGSFEQLLVFGPSVRDVVELVSETRILVEPPVELSQGIYWFSGVEPGVVLLVAGGASPGSSSSMPIAEVPHGSPLDNALGWIDSTWESAPPVATPLFSVGQDVIVNSTGHDGLIRP